LHGRIAILKTKAPKKGPMKVVNGKAICHIIISILALSIFQINKAIVSCVAPLASSPTVSKQQLTINGQEEYGLTPLQFATLIGDLESMAYLFDEIKQQYGTNTQQIFDILNQRNKAGLNILGLAELDTNRRVVELVMMRVADLIGHNKNLFYKFVSAGDYARDWTPLMDAAFDSEGNNLNLMVKVTAHVLGRDSQLFKKFINKKDKEGDTALSMAEQPADQFFLQRFGATNEKVEMSIDPELIQAQRFGYKLIQITDLGDFKEFKKTMREAVKAFSNKEHLLYHMLATRDEAGWNPIMHAAAHGRMAALQMILHEIEQHFPKNQQDMRLKLLSNNDYEGRTALHIALSRHYYKIAHLLLDKLIDYAENKAYLFTVLNAPDELNGYTPLIYAVYGAYEYDQPAYNFLKYMLSTVAKEFGRNSRMFELFINARDYNNQTPLAYVSEGQMDDLLISYGAVDKPMKKIPGIGDFARLEIHGEI
jgi:ankyrin repeat protein